MGGLESAVLTRLWRTRAGRVALVALIPVVAAGAFAVVTAGVEKIRLEDQVESYVAHLGSGDLAAARDLLCPAVQGRLTAHHLADVDGVELSSFQRGTHVDGPFPLWSTTGRAWYAVKLDGERHRFVSSMVKIDGTWRLCPDRLPFGQPRIIP